MYYCSLTGYILTAFPLLHGWLLFELHWHVFRAGVLGLAAGDHTVKQKSSLAVRLH